MLCALALGGWSFAFGQSQEAHEAGQLLVKLNASSTIDDLIGEMRADGRMAEWVATPSKSSNIHLIQVPDDELLIALRQVERHPQVEAVQFNHFVEERQVPNDPNFGQQWHHVQSGDHDIDSDLAWDITTGGFTAGGDRIVVCVIEGSGSNYNHVDLIDNHWTNPHEIDGNGIDDDGNGYVDDVNGWNTGNNNDNVGAGGHGTSVSGMIGATGDNGNGGVGVNWDIGIMQVDMAGISESNVIAAYEYPKVMRELYTESGGEFGAFVVATNASWGIDGANPANYPVWCAFYDDLGASGILNCGATTNQNFNVDAVGDMPTACDSDYMISVTATNNNDVRTFSGYGATTIDLAAPGDNVYLPSGSSGYGNTSGTSFASPCVAGAIGLIYSAPCSDLASLAMSNPQAAADLVRGYLLDGVDVVSNLVGETVTGGRLNVANSLGLAMGNCGPVECNFEGLTAVGDCWYNELNAEVTTSMTFTANFDSFLCSADSLCWGDGEFTCFALADSGWTMSNGVPLVIEQWTGPASFSVFATSDSLHSDTLDVIAPDCSVLVPGCTYPTALNFDEAATIDDGSCEFACTDVTMIFQTDCYPEESSWSIADEEGNELAGVEMGAYSDQNTEFTWSGCLTNGCLTLTVGDDYGDGLNGSVWFGCNSNGNYVLSTADGLELVTMGDPDFGNSISHVFCLPVIEGCTDELACNFDSFANTDDGSCLIAGESCDDGDPETTLDSITEDCGCAGVPIVEGCTNVLACNFDAAANVDNGSCLIPGESCDDGDPETVNDAILSDCTCLGEPIVEGCMDSAACNFNPEANVDLGCTYVGLGEITYDVEPMAGSETTFTYNPSNANNVLAWNVIGGSILGANDGAVITVLWDDLTINGTVEVIETETATDCADSVNANYALLPNAVTALDPTEWTMYPNPGNLGFWFEGEAVACSVYDASGRQVLSIQVVDSRAWVDASAWSPGVYTVEATSSQGRSQQQWLLVR